MQRGNQSSSRWIESPVGLIKLWGIIRVKLSMYSVPVQASRDRNSTWRDRSASPCATNFVLLNLQVVVCKFIGQAKILCRTHAVASSHTWIMWTGRSPGDITYTSTVGLPKIKTQANLGIISLIMRWTISFRLGETIKNTSRRNFEDAGAWSVPYWTCSLISGFGPLNGQ